MTDLFNEMARKRIENLERENKELLDEVADLEKLLNELQERVQKRGQGNASKEN